MHAPVGLASGLGTVLDILLADIAIRLQLSQTAHAKAVARYEAIRKWIEREGSPFAGLVDLFYPQGSMAIGATIASKVTNDEYDLDVVVQLRVPPGWSPKQVLDALYESIRGTPGSRYYDMVQRRARCVTVSYADMHLDLIPMERRPSTRERESDLFVHQADGFCGRSVVNSFGFAEWFTESTADAGVFGPLFAEQASKYYVALAKADADPVPEQEPAREKSLPVVALQLLKRWRNVLYQHRTNGGPPSVLLSKFAADRAGAAQSLAEELLHQAAAMREHFRQAENMGTLIRVSNPVCAQDVLTDRWPADRLQQREFLRDLEQLIASLDWLRGDRDLEQIRGKLAELFGEWPAGKAVEAFNQQRGEEIGHGRSRHHRRSGSNRAYRGSRRCRRSAAQVLWRCRSSAMKCLTIREQDWQVRRRWPSFETVHRDRSSVVWEGTLQPLCKTYTVRVGLQRPGVRAESCIPSVVVVAPPLRHRPDAPEEPIPHIYDNPDSRIRDSPLLCLYLVVPAKMGMVNGARIGVDMLLQGQALSALEAARILLGDSSGEHDRVCRVDETVERGFAKLDDAARMEKLEGLGRAQARVWLPRIRKQFLMKHRQRFVPCREVHAVAARAPPRGRCSPQGHADDTV